MIRAYIGDNWAGGAVAVAIVLKDSEHARTTHILRFHEHGEGSDQYLSHAWEPVEDGQEWALGEPTLRLQYEVAQVLLAALHSHFQGVDDQRALRQDYDAERGRVDKLIGALIDVTKCAEVG